MLKDLRPLWLIFTIGFLLSSVSYSAFAASEVEQKRYDAISNNCSSIKIQLYKTQKNDSKTRVNVGAYYETISSKLMMNLNLRLVKNNIAATDLAEQQSEFSSLSRDFKDDFIDYSQELEELVAIDCQKEPEKFDKQLSIVRRKRGSLSRTVERLNGLAESHYRSVTELKDKLFGVNEGEGNND